MFPRPAALTLAVTACTGPAEPLHPPHAGPRMVVQGDFGSASSGEQVLEASPEAAFEVLVAVAEVRARADLEVFRGSMRVQWTEDGAQVIAFVRINAADTGCCTLRITAAELGVQGRADLAAAVGAAVRTGLQ